MGGCHLISAMLLLLVARPACGQMESQRLPDDSNNTEVATLDPGIPSTEPSTLTALAQPSTQPPSVQQLENKTPASSAALDVTWAKEEVPTSHEPMIKSAALDVTSAKEEVSTSHEPMITSTGLMNVTLTVSARAEVTSEPSTTALPTELSDTTPPGIPADVATIPARGDIDSSESPKVDLTTPDPSTTQDGTDGRDTKGYEPPDGTDKKNGREDDLSIATNHDQEEKDKKERLEKQREEKSRKIKKILIGVIVAILLLLLVTAIFFLLRKKRRSGSFRTQSRKGPKQDVWAGQVPELGDGKAAQDPAAVENGSAGAGLEPVEEEEMVTFVPGEKKVDSMVEMNELGSGEKPEANGGEKVAKEDVVDEKTPLIEEAPEKSPEPDPGEQFPLPPDEQELMPKV